MARNTSHLAGVGRLEGKVAIVTGAARGLGEAIARRLADEGASVLLADVSDESGQAVADEIGPQVAYRRLDVRRADDWAAAVDDATQRFGTVTTLVNNAAILRFAPLCALTEADARDVFETNQLGPFLGIQAVVPVMEAAGGGSIVNISSVDGLHGMAGTGAYGPTKWALRGLTRVAAVELGPLGIRVNTIFPGGMATAMSMPASLSEVPLKPVEEVVDGWPLRRMGEVTEVAGAVAFLASDDASFCTGAELSVDGGATAGPALLRRS